MYLTYEEYRAMGGGMAEADFDFAEARARGRLDELTDGRARALDPVPEAVKRAMMAVIRSDAAFQTDRPLVTGFNADGYSETYGGAADQARTAGRALSAELRHLLEGERGADGMPLLYRGI